MAALSHDLRSPLTDIRVRVEMVEEDETRERTVSSAEEMQDMVGATMSHARGIETAGESEAVDLGEFVEQLYSEMQETDALVKLVQSDSLPARIRTIAMRMALGNVIENAVRYSGVANICLLEKEEGARISVSDEELGIAEDQLKRVFDLFVRLEKSRARETGGTGLGLSIAQTIIQVHGGLISLLNNADDGLTATNDLPAGPDHQIPTKGEPNV